MAQQSAPSLNVSPTQPVDARRHLPLTLWVGLLIIGLCEVFLFLDVAWTGRGAIHTHAEYLALPRPTTPLGAFARWVAVNMTCLVWPGYLLLLDGLLHRLGRSPVRVRPHHFATLCLASILMWCLFDWINFYFMRSWFYLGMPPSFADRWWGYVLAFGAIVPAMLLSGQVLLDLGWLDRARGPGLPVPRWLPPVIFVIGVAMLAWPFLARNPIANLSLWTSFVFLLDPLNYRLGRPSVLRDWQAGWYGRTIAAGAGGLLCGFLWEFWNYWALAKWTYHLPFLGQLEHVKYFEMPVLGLLGFIAFGIECWVMWQTIRIPLDGLAEPLPDGRTLI